MTFFMNKGSSYSYKRTRGVILVRLQTFSFSGKAVCHTAKRDFSESSNEISSESSNKISLVRNKMNYLKEASSKWKLNGKKLFKLMLGLLNKIRIRFFMLLNWIFKIIRFILFAPFSWIFCRIRNLLLTTRRILRYRAPLAYVLVVNFFSIATGLYVMGMSIISLDAKMKAEAAEFPADYHLDKVFPELQNVNHIENSFVNNLIGSGDCSPVGILTTLIALYIYITISNNLP